MINKNNTRTAILEVAQDMVQRKSISGVSFQDLANQIGIKKGSMYYHFASKDELSCAMLKQAGEALKISFARGKHKTAVQQLDYFLTIYSEFIGAGKRMCPGGAFAGEWGNISSDVKKQVTELLNIQVDGIKAIVEFGLDSDEFDSNGLSLDDLSLWFFSTLQGALLTSRVMESKKSFEVSVKSIKHFLYKKEPK
jgi:TetR/AcrR family transcriptional repressor of nem operon